ncbi:MAG TPA: hypothetical protein EYN00_06555 [Planctomycetes bacterium]|nr:hypothetical protein [Planctomycetota bacterium]
MTIVRLLLVVGVLLVFGFDLVGEAQRHYQLLQEIAQVVDRTEKLKISGMDERSQLQVRLLETLSGIGGEGMVPLPLEELVRLEAGSVRVGTAAGVLQGVGSPTRSIWLETHSGAGF